MSSEHLENMLSYLAQHWEKRSATARGQDESPAPAFTIALEREAGARGTTIAREVGQRLNWPVYDHELLERIAQDMGVRSHLLKSVDEHGKAWALEAAQYFMALPAVSETAYVRHLIDTVLALGAHGECVIVGRGAPFFLPSATTLRVREVGTPAVRILHVREMLGLSQAEAERETARIDGDRIHFNRSHFHKEPTEPENYDLILNSSRFPTEACADTIIHGLRHLEARAAGG
jgi:cytidylate kinase